MNRSGLPCSPDKCDAALLRFLLWAEDITMENFIEIVDSYIPWCNEMRIKIFLGALSPIEYREKLGIKA